MEYRSHLVRPSYNMPFKLLDLESDAYAGIFLFYKCSNKLERISIRNAEIGSSA